MKLIKSLTAIPFALLGLATNAQEDTKSPNVIIILTDDQGYGDIAAHGHPHVITPNMDRLRDMSVRLENFHVDPTCAPTRASLMTGRYSARVGVWHTIIGRNLLREDETTLAEVFREAGYRTGIFGKWHLGDSYPYAARFRGFDEAIVHGAGGVGQTPDYWGNDYFEDHYNDNGVWRPFQGYCTDVWFNEALRFIRESKEQPFFLYLPTNAAHQTRPHVPERYKDLYKDTDVNDRLKTFWGMITNIDDNLGVMMDRLKHWGLLDNTILVFMGDNGTCMGPNAWPENERTGWSNHYNKGMQGAKASHFDGGHRVFGYVWYPAAGIEGGRDINHITAHIDLMPTLMELCNIPQPENVEFDGTSLVPLLTGKYKTWPDRTLFVHNQRVLDPVKWKQTSVMTDRWRLIDNTQLYDIKQDPGQQKNIIGKYPEVADKLRTEYDLWWEDISQRFHETTPLYIGAEQQNPVQLNAHDWMIDGLPPWNQPHIMERPKSNGPWNVRVTDAGRYAFTLRERPETAGFPLSATSARLYIGDMVDEIKPIEEGALAVRFEVELKAGDMEVKTWLIENDGTSRGAYFVEVERLSSGISMWLLEIVRSYADAMIEKGRDVYGKELSPLFAAAMDRKAMDIGTKENFESIQGVRENDRSVGGANPQEDKALYSILYELTEVTGDEKYAREADKSLEYFFKHCQSPETGLMAWGEHIYWDFHEDMAKGTDMHEMNGEWPFWDQCYHLAPDASWQHVIGQWDNQIHSKETGDFSRHARWSARETFSGFEFPRYAGQMILDWTDAYFRLENAERKRRDELLDAISTVVGRMEDNMKISESGYLIAGRAEQGDHINVVWLGSNLELARCLWEAIPFISKVDQNLSARMKNLALKQDEGFHRAPHQITEGGGFAATLHSKTGEPRFRSMNNPFTAVWATAYGQSTHANMANACYTRYKQLINTYPEIAEKYRKSFLAAAEQYLSASPAKEQLQKPDAFAHVIELMINAFHITGEERFVKRGEYFARIGVDLFLDDGIPLPKATNQHAHYETITGGPDFLHAMLKLHEVSIRKFPN